ncbi:uncharacterized protein [Bombus fervidus]|uniref:uncharacterized protein n=1 Tax=Bombus fervidus TaxID=203811 RepID=UPI003AB40BE9
MLLKARARPSSLFPNPVEFLQKPVKHVLCWPANSMELGDVVTERNPANSRFDLTSDRSIWPASNCIRSPSKGDQEESRVAGEADEELEAGEEREEVAAACRKRRDGRRRTERRKLENWIKRWKVVGVYL